MSELDRHPHVRALLTELCGYALEYEAIPLPILCKMYKGVLRAPLAALAAHVEFPAGGAWPTGGNGKLSAVWQHYPATGHIFTPQRAQLDRLYFRANPLSASLRQQARENDPVGVEAAYVSIFRQADRIWIGCWTAILLHRLTWADAQATHPHLLTMLEVMLKAYPEAMPSLVAQAREGIKHA
jgi:hypothetical protein